MPLRLAAALMLLAAAAAPPIIAAAPMGTAGEEPRAEAPVRDLLRRAMAGDAAAQHNLGNAYEYGKGVPQDHGEALRWYELAAGQGLPYAQHALSDMFREGRGVPADARLARAWVEKAADQGLAISQHNLALMYEFGYGVAPDRVKALVWFALAAERHAEADRKAAAEDGIQRVGAGLTPAEIAEAEKQVEAWLARPRPDWPSLGEPKAGR